MSIGAVTVLRSSTCVPRTPTSKHHMYLSSLDLYYRDIHYNLRVIFYEQIGPAEIPHFVATLKQSLAEVLVHFYPLAGRLAREEAAADAGGGGGGGGGGRFVIDCNDAGVEFVEARIDASFAELQGTHFDFRPYFADLAPLGHLPRSDLTHVPLMAVQVTQFMDRGVALAISHSHVVMDGSSLWQFLVSWGECARGLPLSRPPIHARTLFKPEIVSSETAKLLPFELVSTEGRKVQSSFDSKVMHFSAEAMDRLKEMAAEARSKAEGPKKRHASSLEALFAHCWRRVTEARLLADDEEVGFIVLADCRRPRRTSPTPPPVPENFFGNAVTWTCTHTTPRVLREESFAATLTRIADVVDECTHADTLNGMIHWLELHDTSFNFGPMMFRGVTMNVASSPRFPTHLVDYGWGPPSCARPLRVGADGEICLFPSSRGGVDMCIKLDPMSLRRLMDDPNFLSP